MASNPKASLGGGDSNKSDDSLEELASMFGVVAGQPRHGNVAMRWMGGMPEQDMALRDDQVEDGYLANLTGHFAVFNRWTEIDSFFEGRFMESLAPGAFKKTFAENIKGMRCLVQHGRDPSVGMKPLGPIREVGEDEVGARYLVPLLDTTYNRDLLPGLKAGLYGASFRFQVIREEVNTDPGRSEYNPEGIEERKVTEAKVREFGPVTFPAYEDATAGIRSLNDWWLELDLEVFARTHPDAYPVRLAEILQTLRGETPPPGHPERSEPPEKPEAPVEKSAPPTEAKPPDLLAPSLSSAARRLRTSRDQEVPSWKL